jgi:hypothetical protein
VTPATPPPGPTTTTTPTTTTVPTTTTTPAPTPKPAGCASHRVVTLHLRVSVSSRLRSATVTVNGHRVHVSRNLVVRIDLSPYTSTVTVKITGKLRNKHKVHATRRYHPCTAG